MVSLTAEEQAMGKAISGKEKAVFHATRMVGQERRNKQSSKREK